jgi:hypothetical protein
MIKYNQMRKKEKRKKENNRETENHLKETREPQN